MARPTLIRHRKFERLAIALEAYCPCGGHIAAMGVLELLWNTANEMATDYIGDSLDVEMTSRWRGPRGALVAALLNAGGANRPGFIEPLPEKEGYYKIHDYWDHAPDYVSRRAAREAQRLQRGESISQARSHAAKLRWARYKTTASAQEELFCNEEHTDCNSDKIHANDMQVTYCTDAKVSTPAPAPAPVKNKSTVEPQAVRPVDNFSASPEEAKGKNGTSVVQSVFEHWKSAMNHPQAVLDPKRERTIRHALKLREGNSDDLIAAIDGCRDTPWNMGSNDRHTVYDALALILRDNDHIERFMAARKKPKKHATVFVPEPESTCWPDKPPEDVLLAFRSAAKSLTSAPKPSEDDRSRRQESETIELTREEMDELEERKRILVSQLTRMNGNKP